jgi:hypothetical protein
MTTIIIYYKYYINYLLISIDGTFSIKLGHECFLLCGETAQKNTPPVTVSILVKKGYKRESGKTWPSSRKFKAEDT